MGTDSMTTEQLSEAAEPKLIVAQPAPRRIEVIDLFRGLVLFSMFIANNSGGGLPAWMYHASDSKPPLPHLTWVDMV